MQVKAIIGDFEEGMERAVKRQFKLTKQAVQSQFISSNKQQTHGQAASVQDAGTNEQGGQVQQGQQQPATDQFAKEFIQDMYAPTANNQQTGNKQPSAYFQQLTQKGYTPEEAQKLEALRKKLHDEMYYIPLTKRQQRQEEERPAEKVEREKMEELQHEDEKKKKEPPPLAVQMASNKAERFPGVSG